MGKRNGNNPVGPPKANGKNKKDSRTLPGKTRDLFKGIWELSLNGRLKFNGRRSEPF